MRYVIGVDIGRECIGLGLFDEQKKLVSRRSITADAMLLPSDFFDAIAASVRSFMDEKVITNENIAGIGISTPSLVRPREGYIIKTFGFDKLSDFNAAEYLSQKLGGLRVAVDSRGNTGALAELRYGVGRFRPDFIRCQIGDELCAGVVMNGALYTKENGISGLNSHCIMTPAQSHACACGNADCAASKSAGSMIVKQISSLIASGTRSIIEDIAGGAAYISPEHISIAYERGDTLAETIVAQIARYSGTWMYNMYAILGIDYFVLSGSLLKMGKKLMGPIRRTFDSLNYTGVRVEFANSQIIKDEGIIGAMELLHD